MMTTAMQPEDPPALGTETNLAAALQHLQDEMELVGYVTSHDLMAPLRMMLVASETLKEKLGVADSAEANQALQSLDEQIRRQRTLLQGLQEYIRLETFMPRHTSLSGNELVLAATEVLAEEIKASGATVVHDPLPAVTGHRGRLTRLFIHLIENAIKFKGAAAPNIHISARPAADGMWEFSVTDNGIGIDEEHQELVFRLFQCLQPETYPGSGVGLALSQKIVAAHGGRLWVESAPGQGSRFCFTLSAA